MNLNENVSEALAVLGQLAPGSKAAAAYTVGPFSAAGMGRILFLINVTTPSGGATLDFQASAALTSGGSYTSIPGATITQLTAGTNPLILVEIRAETLAGMSGAGAGPYVKGVLTVGSAALGLSAVALGVSSSYYPASDFNAVAPAQTVVV